jgi:hypothetical protein
MYDIGLRPFPFPFPRGSAKAEGGGKFRTCRDGGRGYAIQNRMCRCTLDKDRVDAPLRPFAGMPLFTAFPVSRLCFHVVPFGVPFPAAGRSEHAICERLEGWSSTTGCGRGVGIAIGGGGGEGCRGPGSVLDAASSIASRTCLGGSAEEDRSWGVSVTTWGRAALLALALALVYGDSHSQSSLSLAGQRVKGVRARELVRLLVGVGVGEWEWEWE